VKHQVKLTVAVAAVAIAAGAAFSLTGKPDAPEAQFITLAGDKFVTSNLRGQVVLVNFWATSCFVCVQEMPKLVEVHKKYAPRGYTTVAVAMSYDHPNQVAEFAALRKLPFRMALDTTGEVAKRFGNVRVTPTTYLIDRRGRVLKQYVGEPDWPEFERLVEHALVAQY
jgi:peroxiredoxin